MQSRRLLILLLSCFTLLSAVTCFLITTPRGPLKFDPPVLPDAQVGVPYEAKVTISDNATPAGAFSISEGTLPPGLTIEQIEHENTARISGTPQQPGTFKFTVFVWCYGTNVNGQVGEKEYTITVK